MQPRKPLQGPPVGRDGRRRGPDYGPAYTAYMIGILGALVEHYDDPALLPILSRELTATDCPYSPAHMRGEINRALESLDRSH